MLHFLEFLLPSWFPALTGLAGTSKLILYSSIECFHHFRVLPDSALALLCLYRAQCTTFYNIFRMKIFGEGAFVGETPMIMMPILKIVRESEVGKSYTTYET